MTLTYTDKMSGKTLIVTDQRQNDNRWNDNNIVSVKSPVQQYYRVLDFGVTLAVSGPVLESP